MGARLAAPCLAAAFTLAAIGCGGGGSSTTPDTGLAVPASAVVGHAKSPKTEAQLEATFGKGRSPEIAECIAGFVKLQLSPPEIRQAFANAAAGDDHNFVQLGDYFEGLCEKGAKPHR